MTWSLLAHTAAGGSGGGQVATGAIDTTGADTLFVHLAQYNGSSGATVSDSKGNTWTALTPQSAAQTLSKWFYCAGPTVGTGHTFSSNFGTTFVNIEVLAFSGGHASPFDTEGGATTGSGTSLATGSITPGQNNSLILSGGCFGNSSANPYTPNGGFTVADQLTASPGNYLGGAAAYLIQTSSAAANPTWSWTGSTDAAVTIATFKAAAAGGTTRGMPFGRGTAFNGGRTFVGPFN